MLKLVATHKDGSIADEKVLVNDKDRPTKLLIGLAVAELACDVALAFLIARTVLRK